MCFFLFIPPCCCMEGNLEFQSPHGILVLLSRCFVWVKERLQPLLLGCGRCSLLKVKFSLVLFISVKPCWCWYGVYRSRVVELFWSVFLVIILLLGLEPYHFRLRRVVCPAHGSSARAPELLGYISIALNSLSVPVQPGLGWFGTEKHWRFMVLCVGEAEGASLFCLYVTLVTEPESRVRQEPLQGVGVFVRCWTYSCLFKPDLMVQHSLEVWLVF